MPKTEILHILSATVVGDFALDLEFDNGVKKTVNVEPLLRGPVFEPLRDPKSFAQATVDPICGTVVWPNGADLAPEALLDLPDESVERRRAG